MKKQFDDRNKIFNAKTCSFHFLLITCYGPLKPKLENLCLEKKYKW